MKQKQYRHRKTKAIYDLVKTSRDKERGYTYFYLKRNDLITTYGSKAFDETFEAIEDSSGGEL